MSAFFILLSADNEGNSADSSVDTTLVLVSSDELEPPNNLDYLEAQARLKTLKLK